MSSYSIQEMSIATTWIKYVMESPQSVGFYDLYSSMELLKTKQYFLKFAATKGENNEIMILGLVKVFHPINNFITIVTCKGYLLRRRHFYHNCLVFIV